MLTKNVYIQLFFSTKFESYDRSCESNNQIFYNVFRCVRTVPYDFETKPYKRRPLYNIKCILILLADIILLYLCIPVV